MFCHEMEQNEGWSNLIAVIFVRWCTLPTTDEVLPSSLPQDVVKIGSYYERGRRLSEFLLRIGETPEYERPAGRGYAFERLISLEPKARLTSSLLWWTPPIPSTVYGTNAESCQYLLWHVARAARRVSQIFRQLFLGNGWADCTEIWYAHGALLVTAYAVVTGGAYMHLRTCKPRFCISITAWPIRFNFGVWLGGHELGA